MSQIPTHPSSGPLLPRDIWSNLFRFLKPDEVLQWRSVSKEFRELLDQESLWTEWAKQPPFSQLVELENRKTKFIDVKTTIIEYCQKVKLALAFAEERFEDYRHLKQKYSISDDFGYWLLNQMYYYSKDRSLVESDMLRIRSSWFLDKMHDKPVNSFADELEREKNPLGVQ
jgi:hypothetical protein